MAAFETVKANQLEAAQQGSDAWPNACTLADPASVFWNGRMSGALPYCRRLGGLLFFMCAGRSLD